MKIQGNLATYEFSDLLQWLAQGNKTGVLSVSGGGVEYRLGFDQGRIDMSSSSDPEKHLDNYLHKKGVIDGETLARAERLREATEMKSGQVLVTLGAVSESELAQALRDKTEEILVELLSWDQGSFQFEGGERPDAAMVPINLEVTKLLLESMHRLDQQRLEERGEAEPMTVFTVSEPEPTADTTQAADGLALAEVLDPELRDEPEADAEPVEELPQAEPSVHYAVMTQTPSAFRRLVPYALVLLLSVAAGVFYLANMEASAQAVDVAATGKPILFTRTLGPPPSPPAPVAAVLAPAVPPPAPAAERQADEALRQRYEEELAELRRELEAARRRPQPAESEATPRPVGAEPPAASLPADSMMRAAVARPPATPPAAVPPPSSPAVTEPDGGAGRAEPSLLTGDRSAAETKEAAGPSTAVPLALVDPPEDTATEPAESAVPPRIVIVKPAPLTRAMPRYPPAAERLGLGRTVTLRVLVGTDGRAEQVERVGPKAGLGFDRAAEEAAFASTWRAGSRDGEPTSMWVELRFEFRPED